MIPMPTLVGCLSRGNCALLEARKRSKAAILLSRCIEPCQPIKLATLNLDGFVGSWSVWLQLSPISISTLLSVAIIISCSENVGCYSYEAYIYMSYLLRTHMRKGVKQSILSICLSVCLWIDVHGSDMAS